MCLLYLLLSYFLVVLGQFSGLAFLGPVAASMGFFLCWRSLLFLKSPRLRLLIAFLWFALVQAVQLRWLATTDLVGEGILVVYLLFVVLIGAQFALLSWIVLKEQITWSRALALSGLWALFEWSRLFISAGFTWNPVGLALASQYVPMQMASLFGIYGLSFWVLFVNLAALRAWQLRSRRALVSWALCALFPFAYGTCQIAFFTQKTPRTLSAVLVQPNLLPDEKEPIFSNNHRFVPAFDQWSRILASIERNAPEKLDLIVLPEAAVPFSAHRPIYPLADVKAFWAQRFGVKALKDLPGEKPFVSNLFFLQAIANHYHSEVISGLDDRDGVTHEAFNAAFHVVPKEKKATRYEKRILLPIGEYIPFQSWRWVREWISQSFNIEDSFVPGKQAKLFHSKIPIGISICYEETFSHLMRESKELGAMLFVNVTNDGWYPHSSLPKHHFAHGLVRSVENGTPLLRACNTGITAGVDCFGRVVSSYGENESGALFVRLPLSTFPTLYTLWGNWGIVCLSIACALLLWRKNLQAEG